MTKPAHYDVDIDVIDFSRIFLTDEEFIGALKFNALKYFFRQGRKANTDDAKKCLDYLNGLQSLKEGLFDKGVLLDSLSYEIQTNNETNCDKE